MTTNNETKVSWKTIFFRDSGGFSSKRILGVLGFVTCCIIFVLGFSLKMEIPDFGELLLTVSASLVGLDSITGIWNKSVNKN